MATAVQTRLLDRDDLLTTTRAQRMSGLSRVTIVHYLLSGRLGGERVGKFYFVNRLDLEALARERAAKAVRGADSE